MDALELSPNLYSREQECNGRETRSAEGDAMGLKRCFDTSLNGIGAIARQVGLAAIVGGALLAGATAAQAQAWPSKPIEFIVGFPPGGGTDLIGRAVADGMKARLGVPVVVVNRSGGAGVVGFDALRQAEPNGYTVGLITAQIITANLRKVMQATYRDFEPVAMVNIDHGAFAVHPDTPWKTLADMLAFAKANPGKLTMGNASEGGSFHMLARHLEKLAGVSFKHIPFNGGPAANLQLIGHHIEAAVNGAIELQPLHQAGSVRLLAVSGEKRLPAMPNVPTAKELGYPIKIETWRAVATPKGVAPDIVAKLNDAIKQTVADPEFIKKLAAFGAQPEYFGPQDLAKYLASQEEVYAELLKG
jgi:tripartite-type tricarboxylate transporter receptor subunit TctC